MPANSYEFVSRWRVKGSCGEVADILEDPLGYPRWWPSVYLQVRRVDVPDPRATGEHVALVTKGWLPYEIHWELEVVESRYPNGFSIIARGDFDGRGVWTFEQDGEFVDITFDWRLRAEKPLLRNLSFLLKPLFEGNHRWAMAQGETSLNLELARRRAASDAERARVPAPPGPFTYAGVAVLAGAALVGGTVAYLVARARRRSRRFSGRGRL